MQKKISSKRDRIFDAINITFMIILTLFFIYPFLDTLWLSLMNTKNASKLGIRFFPSFPMELEAYRQIFTNKLFLVAILNTLFRTLVGAIATVFFTFCGAFILAKKQLPFIKTITMLILFTMFFSGGLIPSYLMMDKLNLIGSRLALILPGLTSAWYLMISRNFITSIPASLEEAAMIDGAGVFKIMFRIILPLSMPIVAVIAMWSAIGHWNAWFDAMIYTPGNNQIVLQLLLRRILIDNSQDIMGTIMIASSQQTTPDTVKAASIVVAVLPIACAYPFFQKYFVKGVQVGAVKG